MVTYCRIVNPCIGAEEVFMTTQQLSLTVEAVTPIFMTGADNKTPELRPASFRGILRFWLRALLGARIGNDLGELQKLESSVFGSTHGASPLVIKTRAWNDSLRQGERRLLPHSERRGHATAPAFTEGSQFKLIFTPRLGQTIPAEGLGALALLLALGGVGKRSRRGFGSLQGIELDALSVDALSNNLKSLLVTQPADGQALADQMGAVIGEAKRLVRARGAPYRARDLPDYPVFSDGHVRVLVCKHAFTHDEHPYGQLMVDFWQKVLRADRFRDKDEFGYAQGRQRRASPLIMQVKRSNTGLHLVLTVFRSRLSHRTPRPGNWRLVGDLLDECAHRWDGEYVVDKGGR